jgi:rRNA pseudouridine-1189 N-methylase Emg1 (Nep1/Mra1 family)
MHITNKKLSTLVSELKQKNPDAQTILAVENGAQTPMDKLESLLPADATIPVIVGVGAFPHGDFSAGLRELFDTHLEFDKEVMMAWHVCAETLWMYSSRIGVVQQRYSST